MADGTTTRAIQSVLDRLRLAPNDPALRKELITRAYDRLAVVARRILGPAYRQRPEDTSGLLAEAYLRLETALGEVMPGSAREFLGLAALQMRRALVDLIRRERGRGERGGTRPLPGAEGNLPVGSDTDEPDWRLELMDAVERLDGDEREVVDLLFFNGITQLEAADLLGVDESTVKRRWARARVRLAKWLESYDPGADRE
jgi:RNA polymerase sigma-70 factor (ECF subfamily)